MSELADRLDSLTATAISLDAQVTAHIGDAGATIHFTFRHGAYALYSEAALARQIAASASLACRQYQKKYDEAVKELCPDALGPDDDGIDFGPERRQYRQRLQHIRAVGASPDGRIRVGSRALERWRVVISAGTLRRLTEESFLATLDTAFSRMMRDYRIKVFKLKDEIYGPSLPPSLQRPPSASRPQGRRRAP
jgi:hypothetical protein